MGDAVKTVLVVDDHDQTRSQIIDYIENEPGYAVVGEAINGEQALRLAESLRPNVIFMDLSMPVMSGIEAVHRIKEKMPAVKIIVVTIHEGQLYRKMAEHLRVDGYVCKNSFIVDLRTILRQLRSEEEEEGEE
jgi:DNA-binding NarL/FixJ family response regulator